ncbi:DUF4129 domain-containing protein [Actinokineospora globicatena]|uniref:DUF4129 domain-containing protein n=1 Tax=Actinokineospora globicatena TaxID=103729 RepID=UPI0020A52C2A|nr:DUF4129 domain-containing protein [Actinokineospora globicatena]MCP2300590.1 protein of unknown function (DUF4129) [Actinokineospora globicatena]GLW81135.1 hypothetical protein Aglo01_56160 [Actinokineospora globicatena]GLW88328.1 hypothetical protein Aglo02_59670 [Actinokineospora globicatena]
MSPRLAPPLVATALLLLAVVAARGGSAIPAGPGTTAPTDPDPTASPAATAATDPDPVLDLISGISTGLLLLAVAAMLLFGLVGVLANLFVRRRRARPVLPELDWSLDRADGAGVTAVPHLAAAARTARLGLTANVAGDPGNAVIAAWLALEHGAAQLGTPRAPHETPTEFTKHVLVAHAADPQALGALRRTYQRARFSPSAVITTADVTAAADALARLERSLVGP